MDRQQIAEEVLAAVGGRDNVTANDICMTRLRIKTENPSLVDTDQLSAARGVLGFVKRGENGIEVVFGPGKVEAVHEALVKLTGIEGVDDDFAGSGAPAAPLHVHITQNPLLGAALAAGEGDSARDEEDETSVEDLVSLLDTMDAPAADEGVAAGPDETSPARAAAPARVLVISGPNINMLGIREPDIYGHDSYQDMLRICHEAARDAGFAECTCFQSNHEGDLIDAIQDAYGSYAGIVINPGAYTHTSIAILDAAKAVGLPMIEIHISKVDEREEFRKASYIRAACFETIAGMGVEGYRKAMFDMAAHLGI
ncbi:MAG TPA: type II 3-dehydroquinate dehydratase [Olsenella sp.]|nr:type II 3-dehydroquinate dehydratase [Olsenella sp.]